MQINLGKRVKKNTTKQDKQHFQLIRAVHFDIHGARDLREETNAVSGQSAARSNPHAAQSETTKERKSGKV